MSGAGKEDVGGKRKRTEDAFKPPPWAQAPASKGVHFELLASKGGSASEVIPVDSAPFYLIGRNAEICEIVLEHKDASRRHAALVHHTNGAPYLLDLGSSHGTTVDGAKLEPNKPCRLRDGAHAHFGQGGRTYVLRTGMPGAANGPAQVRASHVLVKHAGSRRPSSWRDDNITRTLEQALEIAAQFRDKIVASQDVPAALDRLARTSSDCSSAKQGGDLGLFGRGKMQKAFEAATYALGVGELSGPVVSDSGVHLILRTA